MVYWNLSNLLRLPSNCICAAITTLWFILLPYEEGRTSVTLYTTVDKHKDMIIVRVVLIIQMDSSLRIRICSKTFNFIGKWKSKSTHSQHRNQMEVNGKLQVPSPLYFSSRNFCTVRKRTCLFFTSIESKLIISILSMLFRLIIIMRLEERNSEIYSMTLREMNEGSTRKKDGNVNRQQVTNIF